MPPRSEREKMLSGDLYRASDPELSAALLRSAQLQDRYNATQAEESGLRTELLRQLLGSIGDNCTIRPSFHCDYGSNIRMGRNCFVNFNCVFLDCAQITIGDDLQMAPAVQLYTATHPLNPEPRRSGLEYAKPITIGNNVWIGGGAIILPGITIGDHSIIGAGSVVTRSVPPMTIAAGNPARVIRDVPQS